MKTACASAYWHSFCKIEAGESAPDTGHSIYRDEQTTKMILYIYMGMCIVLALSPNMPLAY